MRLEVSTIRYNCLVAKAMSEGLLREARTKAGLTPAQLAEEAGVLGSVAPMTSS